MKLAPVFDCGSSLYPQADAKIMERVLANENELNYRIFEIPVSAVMVNGKKIKYFDFISSQKAPKYLELAFFTCYNIKKGKPKKRLPSIVYGFTVINGSPSLVV